MKNKNQVAKRKNHKTLRISDEIHKKIRILASLEGTEIQTLVEKILSEKISEYNSFKSTDIKIR